MSSISNIVDPNLISLVSIRTLRGNIESGDMEVYQRPKAYNFRFNINLGIEREKKLIRFILEIIINNIDSNKEPTTQVASYTTEFIFHVINIDDLVQFNDSEMKANIGEGLSVTLASIAYSTMRGIIHTRTQGTILNGIILPVVDPVILVNNVITSQPNLVTH